MKHACSTFSIATIKAVDIILCQLTNGSRVLLLEMEDGKSLWLFSLIGFLTVTRHKGNYKQAC